MRSLFLIVIAVLLSVVVVRATMPETASVSKTAFARVMETGTIRCAYTLWPKYLDKDPNTGKLSGLSYDYVEALGQALNLKIEWAEEVGWADFAEALKQQRVDLFCFTAWQNPQRARVMNFVRPVLYTPLYAYVRKGDTRFDNNYASINDPAIKVATIDGATMAQVVAQSFPKASTLALPELSDSAQMMMNVATRKADLTIVDRTTYLNFERNNPGQLVQVAGDPLRLTGASLTVAKGEYDLQQMLGAATDQLIGAGVIADILKQNGFVDSEVVPAKLQ